MKKVRYYKLRAKLKARHTTLARVGKRLKLLPSDIIKLETERPLAPEPLSLLCRYLDCDIPDIMDILSEEEDEVFYSKTVLEANSYTPMPMRKKEFRSDLFQ